MRSGLFEFVGFFAELDTVEAFNVRAAFLLSLGASSSWESFRGSSLFTTFFGCLLFIISGVIIMGNLLSGRTETENRRLTPAYLPCTFAISIGVMESILLSSDIASAFAVSIEVMQ